MQTSSIKEAVAEIYDKISTKQHMLALMLAEDTLGQAFNYWDKNKGTSTREESAQSLIIATTAYAEALIADTRHIQAYATTMTAIAYTANCKVHAPDMLMLYLTTWHAFQTVLASATPEQQPEAKEHVAHLTSHLGSMLYHYYYATGKLQPENPLLQEAYDTLSELMQIVEISSIGDNHIDIIRDIIARSEAIGLLE